VLQKCKAIPFDLCGYPTIQAFIIGNLLTKKDTSMHWMLIPHIIYPDREKIAGFANEGWGLPTAKPHLDAKIIFITDGSAISYVSWTRMQVVKHDGSQHHGVGILPNGEMTRSFVVCVSSSKNLSYQFRKIEFHGLKFGLSLLIFCGMFDVVVPSRMTHNILLPVVNI
jgi:hypothetical protein